MNLKNKLHDFKCHLKQFLENFSIRGLKRNIKFFMQRVDRGWDESEVWSLDNTSAKFLAPRLKEFKKIKTGHPQNIDIEQWDIYLDEMIFAFSSLQERSIYHFDTNTSNRIQNGLNLFSKYYHDLWD